ncbi:MAG: sulfurtransferase TusA family protein [Candidatus Bathyarchaeia archaeon]
MASVESRFRVRKIGQKHYELDVRGLVCPYPQLLVTRTLGNLASDEVLEVILDNPPSVRDIPTSLEEKGYEVVISRPNGLAWKMIIQTKRSQERSS